jgi:hypothetical protein
MISKKIIKKSLIAVGTALTLTLSIAFAVNAMESKVEKQSPPIKEETLYTFEYNGSDFSQVNVEDESNWTYTADTDMCSGTNQRPCKLQVSASYVDNSGTSPTLKSATNISAALNTTSNSHYVNGIADPLGNFSNREK